VAAAIAAVVVCALGGIGAYRLAAASAGADSTTLSALRTRAHQDYPGYTVASVESLVSTGTQLGPGPVSDVYFTLRNVQQPGFVLTAVYEASASAAKKPESYHDYDEFFSEPGSATQPVASFIGMWLYDHPGEECTYVFEAGLSTDTTRTYTVGYDRSVRDGATVKNSQGEYDYGYDTRSGTWVQMTASAFMAAAGSSAQGTVADRASLEDTRAAITEAMPGFEVIGSTTDAQGDPLVLVRDETFPQLRMAVDPLFLDPPDTTDGMVELFGGERTRADAFAKMWSASHPGTIIDYLGFDPNDMGDGNLIDLTYVGSVPAVDDLRYEKDATFRYDPSKHTWAPGD
jgi:hypothetical protein